MVFVIVLCLSVCFWYVSVIVRCLTPRNVYNVSKNFLMNSERLSVSGKAGNPYGKTQSLKKIDTACGGMVFDDMTARAGLVYHSSLTKMNCFRFLLFCSGAKLFIAKNFKGRLARNTFRVRSLWRPPRFMAHLPQSLAMV